MAALQITLIGALLLSIPVVALLKFATRGTIYVLARLDTLDHPQIHIDLWAEGFCWHCLLEDLKEIFYAFVIAFCIAVLATLCFAVGFARVTVGGRGTNDAGGAVGGVEDQLTRIEIPGPRLILI